MLNAFLTPTRSFSIVATRPSQCNIINSRGATLSDVKRRSFFIALLFYLLIYFISFLFTSLLFSFIIYY